MYLKTRLIYILLIVDSFEVKNISRVHKLAQHDAILRPKNLDLEKILFL